MDPQQLHMYSYGRNNPVKYNDPNGEIFVIAIPAIASALTTALGEAIMWTGAATLAGAVFSAIDSQSSINPNNQTLSNPNSAEGQQENNDKKGVAVGAVAGGATQMTKADRMRENKAKGDAWEDVVVIQKNTRGTSTTQQLMIRTNGTNTPIKIDIADLTKNNLIKCLTECKSSDTAGFTKNQKIGFPDLEKNGGTVISTNKPVQKGTQIAPQKVNVVRPSSNSSSGSSSGSRSNRKGK
jgi:hypothetical protein